MPFITQERREIIAEEGLEGIPGGWQAGDLCYVAYKDMLKEWNSNPRWLTAHNIYVDHVLRFRKLMEGTVQGKIWYDHLAARELAWQVFFNLHVMKYELEKQKENGDV